MDVQRRAAPPVWALRRGVKRAADDSNLNDELRFAKRFNCLNLNPEAHGSSHSNYYIPVSNHADPPPALIQEDVQVNDAAAPPEYPLDEHMQLDDTRDRVYIHDLDQELAAIERDEELHAEPKLIFLPDIEKHFSRIPQQVLRGHRRRHGGTSSDTADDDLSSEGQELVLYNIPRSLTVDEDHDSVRRAIIETRQRAREKAVEEARREDDMVRKYDQTALPDGGVAETAHGYQASGYEEDEAFGPGADSDAMDIG